MGRKSKRSRSEAEHELRRARLRGRAIVAEARAWAADVRTEAAEAHAAMLRRQADEDVVTRRHAQEDAARIVAEARAQADYMVAQARVVAEAEHAAAIARAELQAERLQVSATAALDQSRAEMRAERERALAELEETRERARAELEAERTRLRDQALLEAARIRDEARTGAAAEVASAESERERILAEAHAEAFAIVEQARADAGPARGTDPVPEPGPEDAALAELIGEPTGGAGDPFHEEFWSTIGLGASLDDVQPMLAVDPEPSLPGPIDDAAPFELTPLTGDVARPRDPAIVPLAEVWREESPTTSDAPRRRLRRRARRS